jgi:hypothetical protein
MTEQEIMEDTSSVQSAVVMDLEKNEEAWNDCAWEGPKNLSNRTTVAN